MPSPVIFTCCARMGQPFMQIRQCSITPVSLWRRCREKTFPHGSSPEDVERLLEKRNEAVARCKPFELEKRELGKDGKYRWFLVRYKPLRDDQGHIIRWYATGTDIEDRKQAEES